MHCSNSSNNDDQQQQSSASHDANNNQIGMGENHNEMLEKKKEAKKMALCWIFTLSYLIYCLYFTSDLFLTMSSNKHPSLFKVESFTVPCIIISKDNNNNNNNPNYMISAKFNLTLSIKSLLISDSVSFESLKLSIEHATNTKLSSSLASTDLEPLKGIKKTMQIVIGLGVGNGSTIRVSKLSIDTIYEELSRGVALEFTVKVWGDYLYGQSLCPIKVTCEGIHVEFSSINNLTSGTMIGHVKPCKFRLTGCNAPLA